MLRVVLVDDHRAVDSLFVDIEALLDRADRLDEEPRRQTRALLDEATVELVRHSSAETEYVYPVARRVLGGSDQVDHDVDEHFEIERTLSQLDGMDPGHDDFPRLVHKLIEQVRDHVAEEERTLLPTLEERVDFGELEQIGSKVYEAKNSGPTHPHAGTPKTVLGSRWFTNMHAGLDRIRDALARRGSAG